MFEMAEIGSFVQQHLNGAPFYINIRLRTNTLAYSAILMKIRFKRLVESQKLFICTVAPKLCSTLYKY